VHHKVHLIIFFVVNHYICGKVPEKLIAETTGHLSIRCYECTEPAMHQAVGNMDPHKAG